MRTRIAKLLAILFSFSGTAAYAGYSPPIESVDALKGVSFSGQEVGFKYRERFNECDLTNTCDKAALKYGCSADPNKNSALMRLRGGVVFFDAKMGLDTDGAPLLYPDATHQPETSLQYQIPGNISLNSDRVPFIVIPLGGFQRDLGVELGDIAAIVYNNKRVYGVVADQGPKCKIGEGSIQLHEKLGHRVCLSRDNQGNCTKVKDVGIAGNVLYFIFPGTRQALFSHVNNQPLQPSNINERLQVKGEQLWRQFTSH
ncbi:glycoside hydrolase family 75 protein [Synechococcus sp. J7-Johnson]|uniref:glycoside hydrolase family 75 protein n=1 Tax=Synechococcus sp. J7-Johnson TaxID=2823737 RepID=UPI0020CB9D77|nr:glycoside hydrolase family 75 protein [Synechococcus sp. J7-Johnson]MCP9841396.1 glycoside hydrolase family 75 protein [Synechococcus sp. J7-Johnson]